MVFTFPEVKVADLFGGDMGYWKPDKETIPSVTGTYDAPPADVDVYLRKNTQSYTEESKTITRTVKYFYMGTDGKKTSAGQYKDNVTFKADDVNNVKSGEFYLVKMTRKNAEQANNNTAAEATIIEMEKGNIF